MIRYALVCDKAHGFESWFKNSDAYDKQAKRGLVSCPSCGSTKIEKALMTPSVGRSNKRSSPEKPQEAPATAAAAAKEPVAMISPAELEIRRKLKDLRKHLVSNAEYVGPRFAEEARKMHYGEEEHRSIYGEASTEEAKTMLEEGIEFHPLPVLPDERN